ncbi:MAG: fibronectin type III domain-containing protein [Candidatus Aminicenantes bacterium]|nr:MAG: fibronectin type III domain-containing protein [Candidatus Aminicenantes bacterium]
MKRRKISGSTHQSTIKNKKISLSPVLFIILAFFCSSFGYADADPVTKLEYVFSEPKLERINEYYSIKMTDTGKLYDDIGLPLLPVKTAKILIPQGHEVKTINIVPGKKRTLEGEFMIEYAEPQIPIGSDETVETQPNKQVYSSSSPFPGKLYSVVSTQSLSGYKILVLNLFPVEYIPASGKVSYYERMKVIVVNVPSEPPLTRRAKCRKLAQDEARVKRVVDNPSEVTTYTAEVTPLEGPYEYVIITNNEMAAAFQTLANWKASRGLTTYVETIENIEAYYSGNDLQEKIRNFIDYVYHNWGTVYAMLGGDADDPNGGPIPCRGVYGKVFTSIGWVIDENIPCDMYYGALDGNWDKDGDGIYGEGNRRGGGTGKRGEEADFWAEVYIGRIPADNAAEAYNQIGKIIAYESSLPTKSALLVGRKLDDYPTYGGDYKDEVYTYFPSDWTATKLYDKDGTYSQENLLDEMNNGNHHVVNYGGHGSPSDMGLISDQIAGLLNTAYFLAYSQGCNTGRFDWDEDDCGGEHFTVENGSGGAFAHIGNTRYGFYMYGSTEGAGQQYDKEFFDAIFNESKKNIGEALQDAKEDLQGSVEAIGAMRWMYFTVNLLGDSQTPMFIEPDTTPPSTVADLAARNPTATSIDLTWTAPGDDGMQGTASEYDIRYSSSVTIDTEDKWEAATQCIGEPSPSSAGSPEIFTVTGLSPGTTYYFALKTADEVSNWSGLSNIPSGTTKEATAQTMHVSAIYMSLKVAGLNVNAIATVTIVDADGIPVSEATVYGQWSGATSDTDSGVTDINGQVTFKSDRLRNPPSGITFIFTVTDVVKDGWTYDSSANVETSDFITYE